MNIFDEQFIRTEQPTTCPFCGNRTELILDLSHTSHETQVHQCLSATSHQFVEVSE